MKMDKVAGSGNDEFYTPGYAVLPILEFMTGKEKVWCPFDTEDSHFVRMLRDRGCDVVFTHISRGQDFFETEVPKGCTHIISNPPYSMKTEVLERLFTLNKKFAMLVGVVGLFESQRRFGMFRDNDFEILYMNRRISYFRDFTEQKPSLNPPFSSVYVCHGLLPAKICFREIERNHEQ